MNRFEFLPSVTIGTYLPVDSILHRLDPRARMVGYFLLVAALVAAPRLSGLAIGLVITLALLWVGRIPLRYALRGLITPLPFLFALAVLQVFFNSAQDSGPVLLQIGTLQITPVDFLAALLLLTRFSALVLALSLSSFTLSTGELTQGLNVMLAGPARIGLPAQDLAMIVQVTLRYLPLLAQAAERIAKAQAARGADWDARPGNLLARVRQTIPIIVPLFVGSLRRAESMALAMDARAYGSAPQRTSLVQLDFSPRDAAFVLAALLLAVGVIWL